MQTFQIIIPKPCHEDWNKMSTEERGGFCSRCNKTVFDFSTKTSKEVHQLISEHGEEKLCGRFRNDQLSEPVKLVIPVETFYKCISAHLSCCPADFFWNYFIFLALRHKITRLGKL